jgi:uncharacterized membrane protein
MEEILKQLAAYTALAVEIVAVGVVAYGAIEAFVRSLRYIVGQRTVHGWRKEVWVDFGMWLLLGLQFALAADIVHSAISPTWTEIGQLAAIAAIRTFLNFFLERDIEKYREPVRGGEPPPAAEAS